MQNIFATLFLTFIAVVFIAAVISVIYHAPDAKIDWDQVPYTQGYF